MIAFKGCPRCQGDMMKEELPGEVEMVCLQCGYRTYPEVLIRQAEVPVSVARKAA
jgi:hypothetical protein